MVEHIVYIWFDHLTTVLCLALFTMQTVTMMSKPFLFDEHGLS